MEKIKLQQNSSPEIVPENTNGEKKELTIDEALTRLSFLENITFQTGNVDNEKDKFVDIRNNLKLNKIKPCDAVTQGEDLAYNRQRE
jgi:hypothetical protein